eukprot:gene11512-11607_t
MNFSEAFIRRPIATILLGIGILISGGVAYNFLPVAPLPSVDIPTIVVFAARPGADPETMAASIAAPLERRLGEIAGISEITSTSTIGSTSIIVQFDIARDIDGAAHDVQAAINAATADLPADLPTRPYFRKFNPADAPIMTIALTSDTLSPAAIYDAADSILAQRLSQIEGVAQVQVNGAEKPAVRVRLDPAALSAAGLAAQDVYTVIRQANVNGALGSFDGAQRGESIGLNNQLSTAAEYRPLVVKSANGATLRLSDVASVIDGVANLRLSASLGAQPAILLNITKTGGANVIETADRIKNILPLLASWMPPDIKITILADRTGTIRASVDDLQFTLLITIGLVLLVVLLFMRRLVPTIAAGVTPPRITWWSTIDGGVDRGFRALGRFYERTLGWVLRHNWLMLVVTIGTIALTIWLYGVVPKGFLPTQDTGLVQGGTVADPDISFEAMKIRETQVVDIIRADPAVAGIGSTIGVTSGFASLNRGSLTIGLKPLAERGVTSEQVIARLRPKLQALPGIQTFLYSAQDLRSGGRGGSSNQFVLLGGDLQELREWTQKLEDKLRTVPGIVDVTSDQDRSAPQANVVIDRVAAARLGVSVAAIDNVLNNAFAQRQVSIIYSDRNQYRVVLETLPQLQRDPAALNSFRVNGPGGVQIPLGTLVKVEMGYAPLAVRHQGQFPAATVNFNTPPDTPLGPALDAVRQAAVDLRIPETIHTEFGGNAKLLGDSIGAIPLLIGGKGKKKQRSLVHQPAE